MRAVNAMLAPALYQNTSFDEGFQSEVRGFEKKYQAHWNTASSEMTFPAEPIDTEKQAANERKADLLIERMESGARKYPSAGGKQPLLQSRLSSGNREVLTTELFISARPMFVRGKKVW